MDTPIFSPHMINSNSIIDVRMGYCRSDILSRRWLRSQTCSKPCWSIIMIIGWEEIEGRLKILGIFTHCTGWKGMAECLGRGTTWRDYIDAQKSEILGSGREALLDGKLALGQQQALRVGASRLVNFGWDLVIINLIPNNRTSETTNARCHFLRFADWNLLTRPSRDSCTAPPSSAWWDGILSLYHFIW